MKNEPEKFDEAKFKNDLDALEEEYELELQKLHAEIEQEETKNAENQKSQSEK